MKEVVLTAQDTNELRGALLSSVESSVILLASVASSIDGARLLVRELVIPQVEDYTYRSVVDAELSPAFVARVAKRAKIEKSALIIAHSHLGTHAPTFSPIDTMGEARLAEFLEHRLPAVPHAALVVSEGGVSARRLGTEKALRVLSIGTEGRTVLFEPENSEGMKAANMFDRQIRAFGRLGQEKIRSLRVAVVGVGGTGSIVVQQLVHLGVRDFILIDPDTIEETNLNRVVSATSNNIGSPKVAVAERYIGQFDSTSSVRCVQGDLTRTSVAMHLRDADFIFGCTDSHGSRSVLQQVAYQYLIPSIDMGSVIVAEDKRPPRIFGRVQYLAPGQGCFTCGGLLDADEIRRDMMSDFERKTDPYIVGAREPAPAVISLNATVASLAITMFMSVVADLQVQARHLVYTANTSTLRSVHVVPKENCYICSKRGSIARGDDQPIFARAD